MNFAYVCLASVLLSSVVQAKTITVVDLAGKPQAGAAVLVGPAVDQPFKGNQFITDGQGQFQVPAAWTTALPVTIEGNDIVRNTQMDVVPSLVSTLKVSHTDGTSQIEIEGTLTDFGTLRRDGKVDVGVFIPAIPQDQMIYFDIGWMVSPEYDVLKVLGREIAIPSNVAMPRQEESYFFPITLDKPNFRMFVRRPGNYEFLTLHAQFPLNRVADDFRAGVPPYDIINYGTILESGVAKLDVQQKMSGLSLPVNTLPFSESINVVAPQLASDDVVLSVALSKMDAKGLLIPSDVKRLKSGQTQALRVPGNRVFTLPVSVWLKEKNGNLNRFSYAPLTPEDLFDIPFNLLYSIFQDAQLQAKTVDYKQFSLAAHTVEGQPPKFLNLLAAPVLNDKVIRLTPPQNIGSVKPLSTVLIYSSIRMVGNREIKTEERTRLWEVSTPGWVNQVALPNLQALPKPNADKYRWEVLYLGQDGDSLTHVTRNAVDL